MEEEIWKLLDTANDACHRRLENYQQIQEKEYELSEEEKAFLQEFFAKSNTAVIRKLIASYQNCINGSRNGDCIDFHFKIPVMELDRELTYKEIQYLTFLYNQKFESLHLEELGIYSFSIQRHRFTTSQMMEEVQIPSSSNYTRRYALHIACSISKLYTKQLILKK